jgi:hemolysin activation/secretion protein
MSVLITGSPDFWVSHGDVLGEPHPTYESVSGRLTAPIAARQEIDLTLDAIETNQPVQAFMVREQTLETSLVWRASLSNLIPLPGDVRLGVEAQSQRRTTFFGPTAIAAGGVNIYQIVGGWSRDWTDRFGHAALDVSIHGAPGGLDRLNSAANLADFTSGRAASATYVYLDLSYDRTTPIARGFSLVTQLVGQYAPRPLPDSDEMGLGGQGAVRGYFLGAGAFDDALTLRDELHAPAVAIVQSGPAASQIGPFAFVDFGYGRNDATRKGLDFAAIGLGADLQVTRRLAANLSLSYPLDTAPYTPAGAWRLEASVTLSY